MIDNIRDLILVSREQQKSEPYYEVLEYIQLDGTQYFDTGYYGNTIKTSVDFDLSIDDFSNNTGVCGSRNDTTATETSMCILFLHAPLGSTAHDALRLDWVGGNGSIFSNTLVQGARYHVTCTSNKGTVNDDVYTATGTRNFDQTRTFLIGTVHSGNGVAFNPAMTGKIYVFKIFEQGVLVRDYIPVLDSQVRPCLYDKVSKTFLYHTNLTGSTTPTYKRWNKYTVDYIENTGTAYIPFADITPTTTMGMNIEYAYTVLSSSEPAGVIGTYNGDTQRKDTFFVSTSSGYTQKASSPSSASCGVMVFHRGGNVGTSSSSSASYIEPEKDVWYKATVNWLGDGEITWTDGTNELTNNVGANPVITNQLRLFSRYNGNSSGTGAGTYNNCKARVRKLQFSDGTTIIRSYKPVVWHNSNTTAIATLYDEVYNKMYTPTGSLKAYITNISTTKTDVFTTTGATSGKAINEEGQIINSSASSYSDLLPIVGGTVINCASGNLGNNNYRYHCYDSSGNWIEQSLLLFNDNGPGTVEPVTGSFTAPINAKYVRVSYATQASSTIQVKSAVETIYEVGKSVSGTPSSSVSGTSNCFDTGLYGTQDTTVKHIAIAYDNDSTSGQLFGSYDGTTSTSKNLTINSTGTSGNTAPIRFDGKSTTTPIRIGMNKSASIINSRYGLWVDNALHADWGSVNDFTTLTTLLILKCNNSTNVRNNGCCYCLILEKDVPVVEYIPVKNGNTIGLYDKVSKELNTGVGTINFNTLD